MSSRLEVLHAWIAQLHTLLPAERVTRVRGLALFALGMVWAGTVRVSWAAAALPLGVRVSSRERRLRRFLANPHVTVEDPCGSRCCHTCWRAGPAGRCSWSLIPRRIAATWTVLWVGVVVHRRVLPLTWQVVPQQEPWPETLATLLPALLEPIAAALPAGCTVTLLGDRGVAGPTLIDAARQRGWDVVLRRMWGRPQAHRLRLVPDEAGPPGEEWRLWDWVETVGTGWTGAVQIFKGAGWREGYLTVHRRAGMEGWWILFSTRPGGRERIRQYARRSRVEATFADGKRRGWGLEQSRVTDPVHLDRLLLVWHLALWRPHALDLPCRQDGQASSLRPPRPARPQSAALGLVVAARPPPAGPLSSVALPPHYDGLADARHPLMPNCQGDKGGPCAPLPPLQRGAPRRFRIQTPGRPGP